MTFTALLSLFGGALVFAAMVAVGGVALQRWRVRRCVALLEAERTDGSSAQPTLPVLFATPGRRGAGAVTIQGRQLKVLPVQGKPLEIRLREVRALSSRLRSRPLSRYQRAAPTFHLDLRGDQWLDLVVQSADQHALERLRSVLSNARSTEGDGEDPSRAPG